MFETKYLETSKGKIAYIDSDHEGPVVIAIHGNSGCKKYFEKQYENLEGVRVIAIDLPGHGQSSHVEGEDQAQATYHTAAYADLVIEIAQLLNIKQAYCLGLSLGGHVGINLLDKWPGLQGLIAIGTPPIESTQAGIQQGFLLNEEILKLLAKEQLNDAEAKLFTLANGIPEEEAGQFIESTKRTDGRTRRINFEALLDGRQKNQRKIIEETQKPVRLLLGEHDEGISNSYIQTNFPKLLTTIPGVGHAANWSGHAQCNEIITKFCQQVPSSNYADAVRAAGGSPIYTTGNAPGEVTTNECPGKGLKC